MQVREQLQVMLVDSVNEYAQDAGIEIGPDEETRLVGQTSSVDSLGLVTIVLTFEAQMSNSFDTYGVLANEKAMSMERSVASLVDYAATELQLAGNA